MELFHIIDDPDLQIILRHKGVYKQAKLAHRGGKLYAVWGSGFLRVLSGGTSKPDVTWEEVPDDWRIEKTATGFLWKARSH